MTKHWFMAAAFLVLSAATAAYVLRARVPDVRAESVAQESRAPKAANPVLPAGAEVVETAHYRIHSTASPMQTAQVARAVESLYARYATMFPRAAEHAAPLVLVLYRDRAEFKRNNRSRPWAEAYYLPPRSYAYFDAKARTPTTGCCTRRRIS